MFPSLDPIRLRESDSDDVIYLINQLSQKGRQLGKSSLTQVNRKKVYADQVNWV